MDDEIVVGVNIKNNTKKKNNGKNKKKKVTTKNKKITKKSKILFCTILVIIAVLLILNSPLFNVKNIVVEGNATNSSEKIVSLSGLQTYTNIFKFNENDVIEKIKENAYIENVKIEKKLPSTVKIIVEERTPKYMLQFADSYVYINNQGYMLEISNEKLNIPILIGFTTDLSNIKAGNRITIDDLKKMDMVIKIYETAKSNGLADLVTKIDISNDKNYTIILETEGKKVYLGDCSNLNTRILYLNSILEASKGKSGEIFLNMDLNEQNPYFRPSSY